MIVIIVRQAGLSRKILGPLHCSWVEAHRHCERIKTRAWQLGIREISAEVTFIEQFNGGNLDRALQGFAITPKEEEHDGTTP